MYDTGKAQVTNYEEEENQNTSKKKSEKTASGRRTNKNAYRDTFTHAYSSHTHEICIKYQQTYIHRAYTEHTHGHIHTRLTDTHTYAHTHTTDRYTHTLS